MHDLESIPMIRIARGKGAWLIDADGRRCLDGISSWSVDIFGHANPRLGVGAEDELPLLAQLRSRRKSRFIALSGSHHGETFGALSMSDVAL